MMKKILLASLCLVYAAAFAQIPYKITGKVSPSHYNERVLFVHELQSYDTTRVKADGTFEISGTVKEPKKGYLRMGDTQPTNNMALFIAGNVHIEATDSLKFAKITGNIESVTYKQYEEWIAEAMDVRKKLFARWNKLTSVQKKEQAGKELNIKIGEASEAVRQRAYQFIANHPNRYVSLFLLEELAIPVVEYRINMEYLAKLDSAIVNTPKGKDFKNKVLISKNRQIGTQAKLFTLPTHDGLKLNMQDVVAKGKYTLIDFWASWCLPCRKENPNLLQAYNTYHAKGFDIIAVSLDNKGENWKKAIKDDGLPWHHASNLLGWKDPIAEWYGINVIPQNLLVDSKGNIVAVNLRGSALDAKLSMLFD